MCDLPFIVIAILLINHIRAETHPCAIVTCVNAETRLGRIVDCT